MQVIGPNVLHYRKEAGMTQTDLADAIGMSGRPYICEIEQARNCPSVPALFALADALGVPVIWLLAV